MQLFFTGAGIIAPNPSLNKLSENKKEKAPDLSKLTTIHQWQPGWPKYQAPKGNNYVGKYMIFNKDAFLQDYADATLLEKRSENSETVFMA